jgi:dihydrolipoamide dehydrogenase
MKKFDVVVLGSGPAGMTAGMALTHMGKNVAMVHEDKSMFGGVCLNMGCMPTKSLLKTATVYRQANHSEKYSLDIKADAIDLNRVLDMVTKELDFLRGHIQQMADSSKATYFYGLGSFKNENEINILYKDGNVETIYGDKIIIATGSVSAELPFAPFDGKRILSSDHMLKNTEVPEKLLIVGGGAIGCEFATMYNSFGSEVTIVEALPTLLPRDDAQMGEALKKAFESQNIKVHTKTMIEDIKNTGNSVKVKFENQDKEEIYDMALIAIGRKPRLSEINLDAVKVKREKGFILVNDFLQTNIPNIYAAGDVIGKLMLVHAADQEGSILAKHIGLNSTEPLDETAIPRVVFSYPEAGSVGITEETDEIASFAMERVPNGRILLDKTTPMFMKAFVEKESGVLKGACMVGELAAELIHELTLAVENKLTVEQIKNTVHAHPSHAASISTLFKHLKI